MLHYGNGYRYRLANTVTVPFLLVSQNCLPLPLPIDWYTEDLYTNNLVTITLVMVNYRLSIKVYILT